MHYWGIFTRMEVRKWECRTNTNKTMPDAKTYFEILFKEKQNFQDDTGAGKSRFKSVNNVGEAINQRIPLDEQRFWGQHH